MATINPPTPKFNFSYYRFIGPEGKRTTEVARDFAAADGKRSLVDRNAKTVELATQRVNEWAASKGITVAAQEPFPSVKHPGKVWIEFSDMRREMFLSIGSPDQRVRAYGS